jgi:hypothetical protein
MKISQILLDRIRKECSLFLRSDTVIERTYYQERGQLSAGCHRWFTVEGSRTGLLTSIFRVRDLVRCKKLVLTNKPREYGYEVWPSDEDYRRLSKKGAL